jgi:hypothetical protein
MIPADSIVVFWNTVMTILGFFIVTTPYLLIVLYLIDRKIVRPQYEKIKEETND